jgi:hypothetical protein
LGHWAAQNANATERKRHSRQTPKQANATEGKHHRSQTPKQANATEGKCHSEQIPQQTHATVAKAVAGPNVRLQNSLHQAHQTYVTFL